MKALVTGAGGFLSRRSPSNYSKPVGKSGFARGEYLELESMGIDMCRGDVADAESVGQAVSGVDVVFHVAALPGVWGPRSTYYRTNTLGTLNIIAACRQFGVQKLVYTSTPSVVHSGGHIEGADVRSTDSLYDPLSMTKALAERAVLEANGRTLCHRCLRPHLIGDQATITLSRGFAACRPGTVRWKAISIS